MRTNIDIDDRLMKQAMKATGTTTKKAAVEASLRQMVQLKNQRRIIKLAGKVVWRGHDDDWFASDAEIRRKRREAERSQDRNGSDLPVSKQPSDSRQEIG
jgi:Arc/MetJ family transcription regulator